MMNDRLPKNISEIKDPFEFECLVRHLLDEGIEDYELDELDDLFAESPLEDRRLVVRCVERLIVIYAEFQQVVPLAYAYNTLLGSLAMLDDINRVLHYYEGAINFCLETDQKLAGRSLVENTLAYIMCSSISSDVKLSVLAITSKFLATYEYYDDLLKVFISAAYTFAENNAYDSAYRALEDAEQIAIEKSDPQSRLTVLSVAAGISLQEGNLNYSLQVAEEVLLILEEWGLEGNPDLLANMATAYQRKDQFDKAIQIYESIIHKVDSHPEIASQLFINLSICHRKTGKTKEAINDIKLARKYVHHMDADDESLLELELVAAANYAAAEEFDEGLACIVSAAVALDVTLRKVVRLHFRRGFRQRFTNRIEPLLCSLPPSGTADKLLWAVAVCRNNSVSDWMHLLDWIQEIMNLETIPEDIKQKLRESVVQLKNYGVPFLVEHLEKYDDPFMHGLRSPWEKFCFLLEKLQLNYGVSFPYSAASTEKTVHLLKKRLDEQCVIVVHVRDSIFFITGNRYFRYDLLRSDCSSYYKDLISYRFEMKKTSEFSSSIEQMNSILTDAFKSAAANLRVDGNAEFIYMPDPFDSLPIMPSFVKVAESKRQSSDEGWTIRISPILYPKSKDSLHIERVVGVSDDPSVLLLSVEEIQNVSSNLRASYCLVEKDSKDAFISEMSTADALIITTHGFPLANFKHPYFASLSGPDGLHVISTERIQRSYASFPYQLVMMNSCHSASSIPSKRNGGMAHDVASFPILMLMNKRSSVVASSWRVLDKISYIFSHLFSLNISIGFSIQRSFLKAVLDLSELSQDEAMNILSQIVSPEVRMKCTGSIHPNQLRSMVSHPYSYGTFQLFTLF